MERTDRQKQHHLMKIVCFILGYVFLIGTGLLGGYGIDDGASQLRQVGQMTLVELAALVILLLFYKYVCRRLFPATKEYQVRFPNWKMIVGVFCICPLVVYLYANVVFFNFDHMFGTVDVSSWSEVMQDLMYLPVAAIIGPIFEEMCCRVMCITPYATRIGKVIALFMTTMVFALCHGANFVVHIPGALIYGIVLICTKNIGVSMILHMAWNTAAFIVPDLSSIVVLLNPHMRDGVWGSPIAAIVFFVCAFILGIVLVVAGIKGEQKQ